MIYAKVPSHSIPSKEPLITVPMVKSTIEKREQSGLSVQSKATISQDNEVKDSENYSGVEADSSDTISSDSIGDSGEEAYEKFQLMLSKRQRKVQRGKSLKNA